MALPTTKPELVTYIKRRLGEPLLTVNVANNQIDARIDDAVALFQDYHFSGSERFYFRHLITASNAVLTTDSTGTFTNGEIVIGQTSNVYAKVYTQTSNTIVQFTYQEKPLVTEFTVGETIVGQTSNASGVISSTELGDMDNEYIPTPNNVISIIQALRLNMGMGGERSTGLFSTTFPMIANDIMNIGAGGGELLTYELTKQRFEMIHDILIGDVNVRFNSHIKRIYMDVNWAQKFIVGNWMVFEGIRTVDPTVYGNIWGDRFVRDYATALTKKQWGQNLMKFQGVAMPGGVVLNGKAIYDEGAKEAKELEDNIQNKYEMPLPFMIA